MTTVETKIIDVFAELVKILNAQSKDNFLDIRQNGIKRFERLGIPTRKNEDWKYTPVNFLNNYEFSPVFEKTKSSISFKDDIRNLLFDDLNENLLVFINGFYDERLSKIISNDSKGLFIGSIQDALDKKLDFIKYFGMLSNDSEDPMVNLNNAFFSDGALIELPDNYELNETIHILSICDSSMQSPMVNLKNVVKIGKHSKVKIVETSHVIGKSAALHNSTTEIYTDSKATVHYYKLQNEEGDLFNIGHTIVSQKDYSVFRGTAITLKSRFVRNTLETRLEGEFCESNMDGFYFVDNNNFVDNHTAVIHGVPNCESNETYRGILDGKSIAVFNGKVIVKPDAQKTVAYQSNKNILLSDDATINTKPQLEIFADDVKCSHGATTGSLDYNSLFYLRARGVSENKAKSLLLNAFAADVVDNIHIPELRDNIRENISKRLGLEDIFLCYSLDKKQI